MVTMSTCPCSPTRLQTCFVPVQIGLPLGAFRTPRSRYARKYSPAIWLSQAIEDLHGTDLVLSRTQLSLQVVRAEQRVRRTIPNETVSPCESQVSQSAAVKHKCLIPHLACVYTLSLAVPQPKMSLCELQLAFWRASKCRWCPPPLQAAFWGLVPLLLRAQAASAADEFAPEPKPPSLGIGEVLLLLAPILLYGVFSLYREKFNPKAKLSDFLFIAVAAVIVLNILSILILKVRLF